MFRENINITQQTVTRCSFNCSLCSASLFFTDDALAFDHLAMLSPLTPKQSSFHLPFSMWAWAAGDYLNAKAFEGAS